MEIRSTFTVLMSSFPFTLCNPTGIWSWFLSFSLLLSYQKQTLEQETGACLFTRIYWFKWLIMMWCLFRLNFFKIIFMNRDASMQILLSGITCTHMFTFHGQETEVNKMLHGNFNRLIPCRLPIPISVLTSTKNVDSSPYLVQYYWYQCVLNGLCITRRRVW